MVALFGRLLTSRPVTVAPITEDPSSNLSLREGSVARGKSAAVVYAVKDRLTSSVPLNSEAGRESDILLSVAWSPSLPPLPIEPATMPIINARKLTISFEAAIC